jgi:copper homeostasis protein (lipoprotein)
MSRFPPCFLFALAVASALVLAGCGRDPAPADADRAPAPAATDEPALSPGESFERSWLGVLPCADCDGIQTRLQLVRDGDVQTYELEETFLGADGDAVFTQRGAWIQEDAGASAGFFRLDPEVPTGRRFELRPDGALDQLDGEGRALDAGGQYRLQRL